MPKTMTIMGRTSSITNAFVNGIIPVITPSEMEILEALNVLSMKPETIQCAYCGDQYTEWDHLNPLVENKRPTGYISEIHNLVPACGKCNQSKGNKRWKSWILSDAKKSPKSRGVKNLQEKIMYLEKYEEKFKPRKIDFETIVPPEKWEGHWENCQKIHQLMKECQILSDEIRKKIKESIFSEEKHEEQTLF